MSTKGAPRESSAEALITKYGRGSSSGLPCPVPVSGKAALIEALRQKGVQYARISEILKGEFGIIIHGSSLGRHLTRRCKCRQ